MRQGLFYTRESDSGNVSIWHEHNNTGPIRFKNVPYDHEDGWEDGRHAQRLANMANGFRYAVFHNGEYFTGMDNRPGVKYRREAEASGFIQLPITDWEGMTVSDMWKWEHVYGESHDLTVMYVENFESP